MKQCSKCKETKSLSEFSKCKSKKDGYQTICRPCQKAYYEANKEKIAAKKKVYREANKEKIAAKSKAYREANKEKIAAKNKVWYEANKAYYEVNKEKIAARGKVYREANKESFAAKSKAYSKTPRGKFVAYKSSAKKRDIEFRLSEEQFNSFWQKPCTYCGTSIETIGLDRMDNIKGYLMENVTPCCYGCNRRKGDIPFDEWNKWMANITAHSIIREEELFIEHHEKEITIETQSIQG